MDILDESFGVQTEPVQLDDLIERTELPPLEIPQGSVRNRAATTALLSNDPAKAVDKYQMMMLEGEQGDSTTHDQLKQEVLQTNKQTDMKAVMSILSDKSIPLEQKRNVLSTIKQSQFLNDSGNLLHTTALAAGSRGETKEAEDARISTSDAIKEIYDARNTIQGLVNAHAADLRNADAQTVAEMADAWVLPFGDLVTTNKIDKGLFNDQPMSLLDRIKRYVMPGSTTMSIRNTLENIPPEKRVEFARKVLDSIKLNSGAIMNDNQFAQYQKASQIFEDGGYSSFDEFLDNVSPLLDVIGVGQFLRGGSKVVKAGTKAQKVEQATAEASKARRPGSAAPGVEDVNFNETHRADWEIVGDPYNPNQFPSNTKRLPYTVDVPDQVRRIEMNSPIRKENPASPAAIYQQSNPEKARATHETVFNSSTDEVAQAVAGVDREQALINDLFPQVATESGAVTSKVADIDRNLRAKLVDDINNTGAIYYTDIEKAQARAKVVNDFTNAEGLHPNDAMSSFKLDGGRVVISAVYGTREGSFLRAEDAFDQAKLALRNYGVLDNEIEILEKRGLDHVPVKLDDVRGKDGNYLVRINTSHEIDPTDISGFEHLDVRRNWFDRIGPTVTKSAGSLSRWMFDAASMIHPVHTGAAVVNMDAQARFSKMMLGLASEYSDSFVKHPPNVRAKINDYIREANYKGIDFDHTDLVARGFKPNEIQTIKKWRDFWDGHFYLENYDVVRTLNTQGYELFKNANTELYVKPIAKDGTIAKVYDPAVDAVIRWDRTATDTLYNNNGTLAKLRRPTDFGGETVEHMVVRNTPTEYTRKFRDVDQVLNYRPGYFQIQYKAPKFVDEIIRDARGAEIGRKTIAVAGDTKEATHFARRMATTNGKSVSDYHVRGDDRALRKEDDAWWDLNQASGRIAQRHRGQLLEDASGLNHLGDGSYILNPVDSAMRAAKSISGRTVSRPMLEAAKARFLDQYGRFVPTDAFGQKRFPKNVKELASKGEETTKEIADARTTYEYIRYLENGYINTMDTVFKHFFSALGDMAGKLGLSKTERAMAEVGDFAPTGAAKNTVFMSYIGSNFLRQWIVQPHQVIRTAAYNPMGWLTGNISKLLTDFVNIKLGEPIFKSNKEGFAFVKFIEDSGLLDAVDKHNLIKGTLTQAADSTNKVVRTVGQAFAIPRKMGFDLGEQANLLGHAAAVYDKFKREGKDLTDKAVRDLAYSHIRALSYDMNFAGDMPYNQTTPALLLQFMQVPHKALLQITNRRLDKMTRVRMFMGDLIMWGGPTLLASQMMGKDILPDNPAQREMFTYGVESWALNKTLSMLAGEKVNIDFSSLAPYEMSGWSKFFEAMYTGGAEQAVINSPAGQLFLKDGGRIRTAVASMARYFGAFEEMGQDKTSFMQMMKDVANVSSGFNNAYKAKLMLESRKKLDSYGRVTDEDVKEWEAWAQALGFGTADTRDFYRISQEMNKDVKKHKEDVLQVLEGVKRYYANTLEVESSDPKYITSVTGYILNMYKDDPEALRIVQQQLARDFAGNDKNLIQLFIKRSGLPDLGGMRDQVKRMPVSDEQKALMMQRIDDMEKVRTDMKENK